jgi:hypothetical protein
MHSRHAGKALAKHKVTQHIFVHRNIFGKFGADPGKKQSGRRGW